MSLIIVAAIIWAVYKAVSVSKEREQQKQLERVKMEQARQREAWKAAQAAERERVRQMEVIEREQMRQRREHERLAKEQEKQAKAQAAAWEKQRKEDERRDAQLAKHEEQIAKLLFVKEEAERAIAHLEPQLSELKDRQKRLEAEIRFGEERFGLRCDAKRKELERVSDKAFSVETKLNKARFNREQAARKMAA